MIHLITRSHVIKPESGVIGPDNTSDMVQFRLAGD